jgi:chemotaxis response regulator CheB
MIGGCCPVRWLAATHTAGGTTMVPDPLGAVSAGMSRNAIRHDDPINLIGPAEEITAGIWRLWRRLR